jgi:hypothetical protein
LIMTQLCTFGIYGKVHLIVCTEPPEQDLSMSSGKIRPVGIL